MALKKKVNDCPEVAVMNFVANHGNAATENQIQKTSHNFKI